MYNYNYFNDEWYRNLVRNNSSNKMSSLFSPEEGYNKGNLFVDLYSQYKNYKPQNVSGKNEKERLLLELQRICFAKHEINLYLDLHPDDVSMLTLFNDYRKEENKIREEYENKYGPIDLNSDSLEKSPFMWVKRSWPWEDGARNV